MNRPWFDPKTGFPLFGEYVADMPSFKAIMADNVITESEMLEQHHRVTGLLQELEAALPYDLKELTTKTFCELAVLYSLYRKSEGVGSFAGFR